MKNEEYETYHLCFLCRYLDLDITELVLHLFNIHRINITGFMGMSAVLVLEKLGVIKEQFNIL